MSAANGRDDAHDDDWDVVTPEEVQRIGPGKAAPQQPPSKSGGGPSFHFRFELNIGGHRHQRADVESEKPEEGKGAKSLPSDPEKSQFAIGPANEQLQSHLFTLPAELRLQIWEELLTIPAPHGTTTPFHGVSMRHEPSASCPKHQALCPPTVLSIIQTCRLAHNETRDLFYRLNRIHVEGIQNFLKHLSPSRQSAVSALTLTVSHPGEMTTTAKELHHLPGIKSLWFLRKQKITFIDPRPWAIMSHQTADELRKVKSSGKCPLLEEVKVIMPEAKDMDQAALDRLLRLRIADERVEAAVR